MDRGLFSISRSALALGEAVEEGSREVSNSLFLQNALHMLAIVREFYLCELV
jgi:hypothetical protein